MVAVVIGGRVDGVLALEMMGAMEGDDDDIFFGGKW